MAEKKRKEKKRKEKSIGEHGYSEKQEIFLSGEGIRGCLYMR
jgi:hypothetical protein